MRAELSGKVSPQHVDLEACFWWAPRDHRSRSSDREMPQFQPRIPHRQGEGWHRRMPKLWGAYSGWGVGAPWSMGMGQLLGRQVWTGQDKQDKQDKPQNA